MRVLGKEGKKEREPPVGKMKSDRGAGINREEIVLHGCDPLCNTASFEICEFTWVTSNAWNQLWYGLSNMHDLTHRINFLSLTAEIFNLLRKSNCAGADVNLFRRGAQGKGNGAQGPRMTGASASEDGNIILILYGQDDAWTG